MNNIFHLLIIIYVTTFFFNNWSKKKYFNVVLSLLFLSITLKLSLLSLFIIPTSFYILKGRKITIYIYILFFILVTKTQEISLIVFKITGLNLEEITISNQLLIGLILINHISQIKYSLSNNRLNILTESFNISNILLPFGKQKFYSIKNKNISFQFIAFGIFFKIIIAESFYNWSEYGFSGFSMNFVQIWTSLICNSFYWFFDFFSFLFIVLGICSIFNYEVNYEKIKHSLKRNFIRKKMFDFFFLKLSLCLLLLDHNNLLFFYFIFLFFILKINVIQKGRFTILSKITLAISFIILPILMRVNNLEEFQKIVFEMMNFKTIFLYYNELYILWPLKINWLTFLSIFLVSLLIYKHKYLLKLDDFILNIISLTILFSSILLFDFSLDFKFI